MAQPKLLTATLLLLFVPLVAAEEPTFTIAPIHIGDNVLYERENGELQLTVLEPKTVPLPDGSLVNAPQLYYRVNLSGIENAFVVSVDPGTNIGYSYAYQSESTGILQQSLQGTVYSPGIRLPCWLHNDLVGRTVGATFPVSCQGTRDGRILELSENGDAALISGFDDTVYVSGNPYPLNGDGWTQVGFERGETPAVAKPIAGPVGFLGASPNHLDAVTPEFTFTEAYDLALLDPRTGLSEFMEANPTAYVAEAHRNWGAEHLWYFTMVGDEQLQVVQGKTASTPLSLEAELVGPYTMFSNSTFAAPEHVPTEMINPEDLASRFITMHGAPEHATLNFWMGCFGESACTEPEVVLSFGSKENQNLGAAQQQHTLRTDGGQVSMMYETTQLVGPQPTPPNAPTAAPPTQPVAPDGKTQEAPATTPVDEGIPTEVVVASTVAAGTAATLIGLKLLGVGLFTRVRKESVLENPARERIMDIVDAQPGVHQSQLAATLDMGHGALDHHLRALEHTGHLTSKRNGGYTCYYPKGTDRRSLEWTPLLKAKAAQGIVTALMKGTQEVAQLRASLGISPSTMTYHTKRLADAGIIAVERTANGNRIRLTKNGAKFAA